MYGLCVWELKATLPMARAATALLPLYCTGEKRLYWRCAGFGNCMCVEDWG